MAFGSSLEEDLVLAPFDVACSLAHVAAFAGGGIIPQAAAEYARGGLADASRARSTRARSTRSREQERTRTCTALSTRGCGRLRSRRARSCTRDAAVTIKWRRRCCSTPAIAPRRSGRVMSGIARDAIARARRPLAAGTLLAATTHWQPAQPISLAFYWAPCAEAAARAADRFARVAGEDAAKASPLGSGPAADQTCPSIAPRLRRSWIRTSSGNALDAIGNRDMALDLVDATARALICLSPAPARSSFMWCTPAFGFARLGDTASNRIQPDAQKRNPDPFELVRPGRTPPSAI